MTEEQTSTVKKRKPRYWIWILTGVILFILVISWMNRAGPLVELQQKRLDNMLAQGVIKKIVLSPNEMVVEVTLKPEALRNVVYKAELEQANAPFGIDPNVPHYAMKIASVDKFYRDYEEATATIPREDRIDVEVEERNDVTGMLINWLFLIMLIFGIVKAVSFFTRR